MKCLVANILILALSINLSAQWLPLSLDTESHLNSVHFIDINNGWLAGSKTSSKKPLMEEKHGLIMALEYMEYQAVYGILFLP